MVQLTDPKQKTACEGWVLSHYRSWLALAPTAPPFPILDTVVVEHCCWSQMNIEAEITAGHVERNNLAFCSHAGYFWKTFLPSDLMLFLFIYLFLVWTKAGRIEKSMLRRETFNNFISRWTLAFWWTCSCMKSGLVLYNWWHLGDNMKYVTNSCMSHISS